VDAGAFLVIGIVAFGLLLVVGVLVLAIRSGKRRVQELATAALTRGWEFAATTDEDFAARWPGAPFDIGRIRGYSGVVRAGRVTVFQMHYVERSFGEDEYWSYSVCAVPLPAPVPAVLVQGRLGVRPEHPPGPAQPSWERRFHVWGDPRALTDETRALVSRELRDGALRTDGDTLLVWQRTRHDVPAVDRLLALGPAVAVTLAVPPAG
jgi:hypothetical protein